HEVVDLVLGDEPLELGQGGRGVGAVEAADRQHRLARGELERGGALRADGGGGPRVARGAGREQPGERAADLGAAAQAAAPAEAATSGPAAAEAAREPAGTALPAEGAARELAAGLPARAESAQSGRA